MLSRLLSLFALWLLSLSAAFAEPPMTAPSVSYSSKIPSFKAILGYEVGERFTSHSDVERYFKTLAAESDRLRIEPYGKTYEGRSLYTVILSSPKNLAKLEHIRAAHAKLADPRRTTPEEAKSIAAATPVLVWLAYNVHGNEAASTEAAMQVAYELAASQDQRVLNWLDHAVIVMDPMENPDGRDRYVNWYRQMLGVAPRGDRFAAEHQERWPGGRPNHYLFDLNRDWAWQSQVETQQRIARYLQWNPQVHVDFHEMGNSSTYFFFPPAKPVLPWLDPLTSKWYQIYGKANAAAMDRYGVSFFTKEKFDLFYPSYGDIWPTLNGAIGMTYEQGGIGAGLKLDLPDGQRTVTLRNRSAHHFLTSLATIETSVQNREARLRDFYEFHRAAIQTGQQGTFRAVYLIPGRDPFRMAHLIDILLKQGIEVKQAAAPIEAEELTSYWGEKSAKRQLPAGTYVVDLAQPAGFLARALLDRDIPHSDDLFFFDVSGWTLPLAADIEAYMSGKSPVATKLAAVTSSVAPVADSAKLAEGAAYVFASDSLGAMRLLGHLLDQDLKAYVSLKPMTIGGQQFPAGTVVVPRDSNPDDVKQRLTELAATEHVAVASTPSTMVDDGMDLGSNSMRFLRKPRIAVVMDSPTNSSDYGSLWFLFEQRLDLPFTPLQADSLRDVDLNQYNVLILPGDRGDGRGYSRTFDKSTTSRISDWVRGGGVLIAIRGGAVWATKAKSGLTGVTYRLVRPADERARIESEKSASQAGGQGSGSTTSPPSATADEKKGQSDLQKKLLKYADRERQLRREEIPGAILRTNVDNTHPLGFGLNQQLPVLNDTAPILELTSSGENVVYYPKDNLRLCGFISPENEKKVAQSAFLIREHAGRGNVILFADNPVFRGFWDGTTRLLLNSVFFGNVIDPDAEE